jgi:WD40 repeat protein
MASWDTTASIVDIASLEPVKLFSGHADRVRDAMVSVDGLTMVTISDDRTCRFWDARSGKVIDVATLTERPLAIESCSKDMAVIIDAHGARITIKRGSTKPIKIESQRFGTSLTSVRTDGNHTAYLAGSQVAVASVPGGRISTFTSSDRITASFLNPQSHTMLVGTNTGHIQLWDTSTMTELVDVKCTNCEIAAVGYAVSGDYLFAIGVDGVAKYISLGGNQR